MKDYKKNKNKYIYLNEMIAEKKRVSTQLEKVNEILEKREKCNDKLKILSEEKLKLMIEQPVA